MTPDTARMSDLHVADGVTGERRQAACAALDALRARVEALGLDWHTATAADLWRAMQASVTPREDKDSEPAGSGGTA